jgi:hypothetical protein
MHRGGLDFQGGRPSRRRRRRARGRRARAWPAGAGWRLAFFQFDLHAQRRSRPAPPGPVGLHDDRTVRTRSRAGEVDVLVDRHPSRQQRRDDRREDQSANDARAGERGGGQRETPARAGGFSGENPARGAEAGLADIVVAAGAGEGGQGGAGRPAAGADGLEGCGGTREVTTEEQPRDRCGNTHRCQCGKVEEHAARDDIRGWG